MALKKQIILEDGNTAEYHKTLYVDDKRKLFVAVYRDQTAKDQGKEPSVIKGYEVPSNIYNETELLKLNKSPKRIAYGYLKTLSEFSGYEDILEE